MQEIEILKTKICYNDQGSGKVIIFLHGWGQSKETFKYFEDELKSSFRVISIDLPGFGYSDEPNTIWGVSDYNQMLVEFTKYLKIEEYSLVAHSFGARIAIINAIGNSNVENLILTGAAGIKPRRTLKYYFSVYTYKLLKKISNLKIYKVYQSTLFAQAGSEDYRKASSIMKQVLIKSVNFDLKKYLPNIKVKTILYWGKDDQATPIKDGELMFKLIPNSELIINEREDHYSYLQSKEKFLNLILNQIK